MSDRKVYGSFEYGTDWYGKPGHIRVERTDNPIEARVGLVGWLYHEFSVEQARVLRDALDAFLADAEANPPSLRLTRQQIDALRLVRDSRPAVIYNQWNKAWNIPNPPVMTKRNGKDWHVFWELTHMSLLEQISGTPGVDIWVLSPWGQEALNRAEAAGIA